MTNAPDTLPAELYDAMRDFLYDAIRAEVIAEVADHVKERFEDGAPDVVEVIEELLP